MTKRKIRYFFVDESGDPVFYDRYGRLKVGKEGCSKVLILGFIKTNDPGPLRKSVMGLRKEISEDEYLKNIPSIKKTLRAFHAKDDCPEVREKFYKMILGLNFRAEFIVARKKEDIFQEKYKKSENLFYNDLIINLFCGKLHKSEENHIYFAVRGSSNRQKPLEEAINTTIITFEEISNKKVEGESFIHPLSPVGESCLQIIDYMNWALYRLFVRSEKRYYDFVKDKISLIFDIYDTKSKNRHYNKNKNKFDITKISPL